MTAACLQNDSSIVPTIPAKAGTAHKCFGLPEALYDSLAGARVLVVDDSPSNLALAGSVLMETGCEVYVADSGEAALQMLQTMVPDLILLDLRMPGIDGIETLARIKERVEFRLVPVIILTANDDEQSLLAGFAAGAVDYISKPFRSIVLLARVGTHIQLYRRSRELERLADIDPLTGLPNRRAFDRRFTEEWQRNQRQGGMLGLLVVDIDLFKQYNDGYGHQQGDHALRLVADALQHSSRRVPDFCARYGGEEFVVLTGCKQQGDTPALASHILNAVQALNIPHEYGASGPILTVSIGYACLQPNARLSPASLFNAADAALYRAKANGRNRIEQGLVAEPDPKERLVR